MAKLFRQMIVSNFVVMSLGTDVDNMHQKNLIDILQNITVWVSG